MAVAAAGVGAWAAANAGAIAAAAAVASVAATAYSAYSQKQNADAQAEAQKKSNDSKIAAAVQSYGDLDVQEADIQRNAKESGLQQDIQAMQARGRVNLFAAASGTMGGSVDSMLFDIDQQKEQNLNSIIRQKESGLYSIKQQANQIQTGAVQGQDTRVISSPSWLDVGVATGTAAINAASSYSDKSKSTYSKQASVKGGV
ncbi:MAG: hypothetical protein [Caudoviricetes sp.]|jgi:hypothetical protein|nr:MAG: hypothetical protein [Caudoviricetes sp.]